MLVKKDSKNVQKSFLEVLNRKTKLHLLKNLEILLTLEKRHKHRRNLADKSVEGLHDTLFIVFEGHLFRCEAKRDQVLLLREHVDKLTAHVQNFAVDQRALVFFARALHALNNRIKKLVAYTNSNTVDDFLHVFEVPGKSGDEVDRFGLGPSLDVGLCVEHLLKRQVVVLAE